MNLYLIRGVSGSGKSTLAKSLATDLECNYWEADMFFSKSGSYEWKYELLHTAHKWCKAMVLEEMEDRQPNIIVSNTFTTDRELNPYLTLADEYNYKVFVIVVENRHGGRNIHNVPEDKLLQQRTSLKNSIKL